MRTFLAVTAGVLFACVLFCGGCIGCTVYMNGSVERARKAAQEMRDKQDELRKVEEYEH